MIEKTKIIDEIIFEDLKYIEKIKSTSISKIDLEEEEFSKNRTGSSNQ